MEALHVFNTLHRKKELFMPLNAPHVGMYVCGPTVYGDAHLGHARSATSFDIVFRYLTYLGYRVRYVRNITDVGHLENDADEGEDKIAKKARVEQLEPMEVAQYYLNRYHEDIGALNNRQPSIEPRASGHISEQIEMIQQIMANGFAYESNGSVYFDVAAYSKKFKYGKLSGRDVEEMEAGSRELDGQDEKRHPADFALWKKAAPEHIMRWNSPWSVGFPGWHIECTVMSTKYLGTKYDIHGGGMDLLFPHHEGEIAQSNGCIGDPHSAHLDEAKYWLHNNMITIDGKKMGKSLGNFITLKEFYSGSHEKLAQAYSGQTIRFFMLQAHYRSTLDFSNDALQAAEKAHAKLSDLWHRLDSLDVNAFGAVHLDEAKEKNLASFEADARAAMNDDFNTALVLSRMFEAAPVVNEIVARKKEPLPVQRETLLAFRDAYRKWFGDVLGLEPASKADNAGSKTGELMGIILQIRQDARKDKNFKVSDFIRDELVKAGIQIKDTPDGPEWTME
jgi:cysteinyl-tRNA synthetase